MMKYQSLLLALWLIQSVQAWKNNSEPIISVTITTDIYTTICPFRTEIFPSIRTHTATVSNFVTITDCPASTGQTIKPISSVVPSINSSPYNIVPSSALGPKYPPSVWITTTEIVSNYTEYFPSPTEVVQNSKTYTVTNATTLTVYDFPCTITKTIPGTLITSTISMMTTSIQKPTTMTLSGTTYSFTTAGPVTIPIIQVTTVPVQTIPASPLAGNSSGTGVFGPSSGSASSKTIGPIGSSSIPSSSKIVGSGGSSSSTTARKTGSLVEPASGSSSSSKTVAPIGFSSIPSSKTVDLERSSSGLSSSKVASLIGSDLISSKTIGPVGSSSSPPSASSLSKTIGMAGPSSGLLPSKTDDGPFPTSTLPLEAAGNSIKKYPNLKFLAVFGLIAALL